MFNGSEKNLQIAFTELQSAFGLMKVDIWHNNRILKHQSRFDQTGTSYILESEPFQRISCESKTIARAFVMCRELTDENRRGKMALNTYSPLALSK